MKLTTEEKLMRLPVVSDWVDYKGEIYYAVINYERSEIAKKPMMDLCYCATKALNNIVLKTVQWDKNKFKSCHLSHEKFSPHDPPTAFPLACRVQLKYNV